MKATTVLFAVFGFIALLSVHGLAKPCQTQRLTASSGEFMSAGYPNSLYPNRQRCRFVIEAERGNFVEINFNKFELESPRTDFVKIIDGFEKHPMQVVYYDGIRKTPFTFVSQTRRTTVVLVTNKPNKGRGFHATYRQITPVLKDWMFCGYPVIKNGWGACEDVGEEKLHDYCDITCDSDFQLVGNKTAKCNTDIGKWTDLPQCAMRLDILEICLNDITNDDCLYSAEMLAEHYMKETPDEEDEKKMVALMEELGDEMRIFDLEDEAPVDRSLSKSLVTKEVTKKVTCPSHLCTYNSSKKSLQYNCKNNSFKAQKKKKLSESGRMNWLTRCWKCQNNGCGTIQIYL